MWDNLGEDVYTGQQMWRRSEHIIHMKSKGRWQVLKFIPMSTDKYKVFRDNLTARQAQAIIKLLEE
jgi:hypothetical protein